MAKLTWMQAKEEGNMLSKNELMRIVRPLEDEQLGLTGHESGWDGIYVLLSRP